MIQMAGLLSDGYLQGESLARGQKLRQSLPVEVRLVGHNLVPAISREGDPVCDRLGNTENGVPSLTDKVSAEMESVSH